MAVFFSQCRPRCFRKLPQPQHVAPLIVAQHFAPVTVPFDYYNRHIFITVTLNGTPGMVFLLDSGTNSNILSMNTAMTMGLQPVSIQQQKGLGLGSGKVHVAAAKDIDARIGEIQVANVMAVIDLKDLEHRFGHRIDGILGFPFLQNFVVELDFDKHLPDADAVEEIFLPRVTATCSI